jgi:hypothetical protein
LFQIWATCFQKLIALAKKQKLIFFLAMQNFAPGKKGLIVLSYLTTHASSWNLNNGTHSIITYGSSIVGMLIHVM